MLPTARPSVIGCHHQCRHRPVARGRADGPPSESRPTSVPTTPTIRTSPTRSRRESWPTSTSSWPLTAATSGRWRASGSTRPASSSSVRSTPRSTLRRLPRRHLGRHGHRRAGPLLRRRRRVRRLPGPDRPWLPRARRHAGGAVGRRALPLRLSLKPEPEPHRACQVACDIVPAWSRAGSDAGVVSLQRSASSCLPSSSTLPSSPVEGPRAPRPPKHRDSLHDLLAHLVPGPFAAEPELEGERHARHPRLRGRRALRRARSVSV